MRKLKLMREWMGGRFNRLGKMLAESEKGMLALLEGWRVLRRSIVFLGLTPIRQIKGGVDQTGRQSHKVTKSQSHLACLACFSWEPQPQFDATCLANLEPLVVLRHLSVSKAISSFELQA